jgi:diadenosine tetraphosphatase ApaH/serine/threonine PP2A family protein phosphatase
VELPGRPLSYPLTALISDLHSNLPALETALADARARGARRFVCLGDMIGYGASPRESLDLVMALCGCDPVDPVAPPGSAPLEAGLCLQGNHEYALLTSAEDFNPKARSAIEWTRTALNEGEDRERSYLYWDFLGSLAPAERDDRALFVHGSPRDPVREYILPRDVKNPAKMQECFRRMDRPVCFVGHSHVPAVYFDDGGLHRPQGTEEPIDLALEDKRAIVNVGSVGQPRDGDPRLSYALFDGEAVTFVRLEYDIAAAAAAIRAVPELPEYLAERLAIGR